LKEEKRVHKNWRATARTIPWETYIPSLTDRAADIRRRRKNREAASWNVAFDLLRVPLGKLIADTKKIDPKRERFGFLPYMAKTWLGRLLAESFSERMLSNANIVLTPGNMRLNPVEMEQLVVLRMNREFMAYCKEHFFQELAVYIQALQSRTKTSFLKALMAEPHSIVVAPQPGTGIIEDEFEGVRVTLVRINEPY
jgi:hypothetical protein